MSDAHYRVERELSCILRLLTNGPLDVAFKVRVVDEVVKQMLLHILGGTRATMACGRNDRRQNALQPCRRPCRLWTLGLTGVRPALPKPWEETACKVDGARFFQEQ